MVTRRYIIVTDLSQDDFWANMRIDKIDLDSHDAWSLNAALDIPPGRTAECLRRNAYHERWTVIAARTMWV